MNSESWKSWKVVINPESWKGWKNWKKSPYQGVVKRDWVPTGRIDFATQLDGNEDTQPSEFKLLVEEHRIVESIAGNEHLENSMEACDAKGSKSRRNPVPQIPIGTFAHQIRIRRDPIVVSTKDGSKP